MDDELFDGISLNRISASLPGWPSQAETVKQPGNWLKLAQAFFYAAVVLNEERQTAHKQMYAHTGEVFSEDHAGMFKRLQVKSPAEFCLAFSLELAIKAALLTQGALDGMTRGQKLPFGNHDLSKLAQNIEGFEMDEDASQTLQWATYVISIGKYQVPIKSSDPKSGLPVVKNLPDRLRDAEPLYKRIISLAHQGRPD